MGPAGVSGATRGYRALPKQRWSWQVFDSALDRSWGCLGLPAWGLLRLIMGGHWDPLGPEAFRGPSSTEKGGKADALKDLMLFVFKAYQSFAEGPRARPGQPPWDLAGPLGRIARLLGVVGRSSFAVGASRARFGAILGRLGRTLRPTAPGGKA